MIGSTICILLSVDINFHAWSTYILSNYEQEWGSWLKEFNYQKYRINTIAEVNQQSKDSSGKQFYL